MPSRERWEKRAWPDERGQRTCSAVDALGPSESPTRRKENKGRISGNAALLFLFRAAFLRSNRMSKRARYLQNTGYEARDGGRRDGSLKHCARVIRLRGETVVVCTTKRRREQQRQQKGSFLRAETRWRGDGTVYTVRGITSKFLINSFCREKARTTCQRVVLKNGIIHTQTNKQKSPCRTAFVHRF